MHVASNGMSVNLLPVGNGNFSALLVVIEILRVGFDFEDSAVNVRSVLSIN